jgi:hypothetical protein
MKDPTVAEFVGVTSHSYQAPDWGLRSTTDYPTIPFFQSEAPFGPYPGDNVQDWGRGCDEFNNVADFMNNRTSVYTMWNMVNDETAKSGFDWAQNVMIQVNRSTKQVAYNPHFYAYKHFAHYVKAGAKAVKYSVTGAGPAKTNAFRNPNGDIILVCFNKNNSAFALTLKVGDKMWKASLPANSFNTIKIAAGVTAVADRVPEKSAILAGSPRIRNSTLFFTLPAAMDAQEMNLALSDLKGRTVWSGYRCGGAISGEQHAFALRTAQGRLLAGTYLLTMRIKNSAGVVTAVEDEVKAVQ